MAAPHHLVPAPPAIVHAPRHPFLAVFGPSHLSLERPLAAALAEFPPNPWAPEFAKAPYVQPGSDPEQN
jgi:hypothetical protein